MVIPFKVILESKTKTCPWMLTIEVFNSKKPFKQKLTYQMMTVLKISRKYKNKTNIKPQVRDSSKIIFKGSR
jgi:hypothetical protein